MKCDMNKRYVMGGTIVMTNLNEENHILYCHTNFPVLTQKKYESILKNYMILFYLKKTQTQTGVAQSHFDVLKAERSFG